ncbi:MAG: septal ring lytic transglycosylase RlpA family protein [Treponema sp.]|nr:septal ring lytic transglycosylase RlpA family protein [Treponema sp.]
MKKSVLFLAVFAFAFLARGAFASNNITLYKNSAVASYYADKYHGRKTSNGEIFNMYDLTAAHKTLPFNTKVKVTNLSNGKSVVVRINDRGPFIKGREIDLSKAAAVKIGMVKSGTAKVSLEIIGGPNALAQNSSQGQKAGASDVPSASDFAKSAEALNYDRWNIQLGAFSSRKNASLFAADAQAAGLKHLAYQTTKSGVVRVIIKDLPTEKVQPTLNALEKKGYKDYLVRARKE